MKMMMVICVKTRVEQFPDDFYVEENVLFSNFYLHSVDTIKDHIKSKTHLVKKSSKPPFTWNRRLWQFCWSLKKCRIIFAQDFSKMWTLSDPTLHKIDKMRPFILKYCKEVGVILSVNYVWQFHLPKLFACHFTTLKAKLVYQSVSIIADETILVTSPFWIWLQAFVENHFSLRGCNHQTKTDIHSSYNS